MKNYIEEGRKIISNDKWELWDRCVEIRSDDIYKGKDLENALEIMNALNNGCTILEAKRLIEEQHHSGSSYAIVASIVRTFSDRGEEFNAAIF